MWNFLKNYFWTLFFIALWYIFYSSNDYYTSLLSGDLSLIFTNFHTNIPSIFLIVISLYVIFLIPFYMVYSQKSKGRILLGYLSKVTQWNNSFSPIEKTALLSWIVKLFLLLWWLCGSLNISLICWIIYIVLF